MKVRKVLEPLKVLGPLIGGVLGLVACAATAQGQQVPLTNQNVSQLEVILVAERHKYKPNDQLRFQILLNNAGKKNLYVLGTLGWGVSATFTLQIRDASGKEIEPVAFFDDRIHVSPNDKNAFVKLLPNHFIGTTFFSPLDILNLDKPGKYALFVEYRSPFSTREVELSPFWGEENGTIKSNTLVIEVIP